MLVSEEVLALAKGKLDRADSLRVLAEAIVVQQSQQMSIYEQKISKMDDELELIKERCKLTSLNIVTENRTLKEETKDLKKQRNFWRTLAIGIPTVLSAAATYVILK